MKSTPPSIARGKLVEPETLCGPATINMFGNPWLRTPSSVLGLSRHRLPRWLSEGVSVWEEKRIHPSWARELERDVLNALNAAFPDA